MFTPAVRLLVIAISVALGIHALPENPFQATLFFVVVPLIVYGYFRYGTVWLAFRAMRKGRLGRAERIIDKVRFPDWLRASDRAYYEWIKGALASERGDDEAAELHLRAAIDRGFRTANDRSVAKASLADILLSRGDPESARECLAEARSTPHKATLDPFIEQIEARLQDPASPPR